jgi:hypothetical protein
MIKPLRARPSVVWLIGFISLRNDSASEMIHPRCRCLREG